MDHQTRTERGRQEWMVLLSLLLTAEVAFLVVALLTRHWVSAGSSGLLCVSMGLNVHVQRRRRSGGRRGENEP